MQPFGSGALVVVAFALLVAGGHAALHRAFGPRSGLFYRVASSVLVAVAAPIMLVLLLGTASLLKPGTIAAATLLTAGAMGSLAGARARGATVRDGIALFAALRAALFGGAWSLGAWVGVAAAGLAVVAAWLLPVWAWDALGYHLPLVHDALLTERLRVVPTHIPYVNVYPHLVDLYFVWFRALLPDDTWIELAQLPFAVLAVAATAAFGERAGVSPGRALGFALTFLAVPAVALQLAANYVDIAYAAFLIAATAFLFGRRLRASDALLGALSFGLFLGTKPSAPLPFALLALAMVAHRRALRRPAWIVLLACLVGGFTYVENLVRYGNPAWPVRMQLGAVTLPGIESASYFFNLGLEEPYRSRGWLGRLLGSLYAWPARSVYDMRVGGFGPLVGLVLLPLAALVAVRRRPRIGLLVLAMCALATPAAFWTRYTLALAAALLMIVAIGTERLRLRRGVELAIGLAAAIGLVRAAPGFTDHRVSLLELARLDSPAARAARFGGIDGQEEEWIAARAQVRSGEAAAYDRSLGLPGRLWDDRGAIRLVYLGDLPTAELARTLVAERVRIAALDPETAERVRAAGVGLEQLFACLGDACVVYRVLEARTAERFTPLAPK